MVLHLRWESCSLRESAGSRPGGRVTFLGSPTSLREVSQLPLFGASAGPEESHQRRGPQYDRLADVATDPRRPLGQRGRCIAEQWLRRPKTDLTRSVLSFQSNTRPSRCAERSPTVIDRTLLLCQGARGA